MPELTPVSQAAALQDDLRRAGVEPYAWVINRSVAGGLAARLFAVPWRTTPPVGIGELLKLVNQQQDKEEA